MTEAHSSPSRLQAAFPETAEAQPEVMAYHCAHAGLIERAIGYYEQAAQRAIDSSADLRWGIDGRGFRRLLHPNGICLTGMWKISSPNSTMPCITEEPPVSTTPEDSSSS